MFSLGLKQEQFYRWVFIVKKKRICSLFIFFLGGLIVWFVFLLLVWRDVAGGLWTIS
jgi:hypothetical protein